MSGRSNRVEVLEVGRNFCKKINFAKIFEFVT